MSDAARGESVMYRTLECSICLDIYNPPEKIPKNLLCGHTFCSKCLRNIQESCQVKCSKCRHETALSQGKIDALVTNYAVMEMLESTCEICRVQHWVHTCGECGKRMCESCKKSHAELESKDMKEDLVHAKKSVEDMACIYLDESILEEINSQEKSTEKDIRDFWRNVQEKVEARMEEDVKKSNCYFQEGYKKTKDWHIAFKKCVGQANTSMTECMTRFEANTAGEVMVNEHLQIKHEFEKIVLGINQQLAKMPKMAVLHLNPTMDGILEYIISNSTVQITDVTLHEKIKMIPYHLNLPSTKASKSRVRTKPDYKSATFSQSYGQYGSGPGAFNLPIAIATSPVTGNFVVSDYNNHRVQYLTSSLQPLSVYGSKGSGDQQLQNPWGVAVSKTGKVYIADYSNHRVHVTDENGKCLSIIKAGSDIFRSPCGLVVDNNGLLYVCDGSNYRIQVLKEDGSFVRKFGSKGTAPGQFEYPPSFIAVSSDGKLVVSDENKHIYILTTQGEHIRNITSNQSTGFTQPMDVAIDPDGNIIVADGTGQLVVMTEEGQVICQISTPGTGPGQLRSPYGVTLTADGDILVCDSGNHRLQKFTVPKISF